MTLTVTKKGRFADSRLCGSCTYSFLRHPVPPFFCFLPLFQQASERTTFSSSKAPLSLSVAKNDADRQTDTNYRNIDVQIELLKKTTETRERKIRDKIFTFSQKTFFLSLLHRTQVERLGGCVQHSPFVSDPLLLGPFSRAQQRVSVFRLTSFFLLALRLSWAHLLLT